MIYQCFEYVSFNIYFLFSYNSDYDEDDSALSLGAGWYTTSSSGSSCPDPKPTKRSRGCGGQASKWPWMAAGDIEAEQERWHCKEEPDVEPQTPRFEPGTCALKD